ncbi:MAG: hypothetical protein ACOCVV_03965, partial [Marinobacter sp.]
ETFGGPDGSVTDLLGILPNVQFSESEMEVERLHDLRPASISISGGRPYENLFNLDGVSIDSQLDPGGDVSEMSVDDVPGHEQGLFIDLDLVEEVSVYDSNVPAAHSGFTGGVVELKTRRAGREPETKIHYNTTRSDWVDYRVFVAEDENGEPRAAPEPAEFKRERMGITHSRPVGEASSLVGSFVRSYSQTPDISLGETVHRTQEAYNGLLKYSFPIGEAYLDTSLTFAPFESENFIKDAKDSRFNLSGGGASLSSSLEWESGVHEGRVRLGFGATENSRRMEPNFFNWANSPSRNWGREADLSSSREGGFGDLDKTQLNGFLSTRLERRPIDIGEHRFSVEYGGGLRYSHLRHNRLETSYIYQDAVVNTQIQCRGVALDCVPDEQYFASRNVYRAEDVGVGLWQSSLFTEGTWDYQRLSLTLGLVYDYDDFLSNHNVAHRSRGSLDVFGTGSTRLFAGHNRYYGTNLLTYKLREARLPYYTEYRGATQNVVNDWERDSGQGIFRYVFSDLDTPYSDEIAGGIKQNALGGLAELKFVLRDNKDGFSRTATDIQPDGYRWYLMNNDGESEYSSISGSWGRSFGDTSFGVSVTYSETETTNATYDDTIDEFDPNAWVWYEGKRVPRGDLKVLAEDFNRPVTASVRLSHDFSQGRSAGLVTRYRGRYQNIVETSDSEEGQEITLPDGSSIREELPVFEQRERPATWITDLNLDWRVRAIGINARVNNLFNVRTHAVPEGKSGIEAGRSFWLGLSANF